MICLCPAISFMIAAICVAISPLTPVSISSKMMVGSPLVLAIKAFTQSINRLISPPEATSLTFLRLWLRLAANNNCTSSQPVGVKSSVGVIGISTFACATPKRVRPLMSILHICGMIFLRLSVSALADLVKVTFWASTSFCALAISKSNESKRFTCSANSSRIAINSSIVSALNLRFSSSNAPIRSSTHSKRCGSISTRFAMRSASSAMSCNSIRALSIRSCNSGAASSSRHARKASIALPCSPFKAATAISSAVRISSA